MTLQIEQVWYVFLWTLCWQHMTLQCHMLWIVSQFLCWGLILSWWRPQILITSWRPCFPNDPDFLFVSLIVFLKFFLFFSFFFFSISTSNSSVSNSTSRALYFLSLSTNSVSFTKHLHVRERKFLHYTLFFISNTFIRNARLKFATN